MIGVFVVGLLAAFVVVFDVCCLLSYGRVVRGPPLGLGLLVVLWVGLVGVFVNAHARCPLGVFCCCTIGVRCCCHCWCH